MNVVRLFTSTSKSSFDASLRIKSIILIISFILLIVYLFRDDYWKVIILITAGLALMERYIEKNTDSLQDINKYTMEKLKTLQDKMYEYVDYDLKVKKIVPSPIELFKMYESVKLDAMYMDANIITFLDSIIPIYDYNPEQFYKLVKGTNNILGMHRDIDIFFNANGAYPSNTSSMLKRSLELKSNCINNLHNFIYSLPKEEKMYQYHFDITNMYSVLITNIINKIYHADFENTRIVGINSTTVFNDYNPNFTVPARNDNTRESLHLI